MATPAALGRVLAADVRSDRTLPPADCSAMDGYAVRAVDGRGRAALPVVFEVPAGGHAPRPLAAGEAARIFTGAPIPPGADCVVRQEDAEAGDGTVRIGVEPAPGDHVRRAGEDVMSGDVVLESGTCIGPAQIGMLASLGRTIARVGQRPRVAVLSGGDELVEPDEDASGGRIVSSNGYSLVAQCQEAGADARNLGIARDTPEDLERLLRAGLSSDVIVSSAGVSVGDHDHVRPVLDKLGCELLFWGVLMKPGYPIVFGRVGPSGPLVFGLPGNPVSAMVTFELFVRPTLLKMAGHRALVQAAGGGDARRDADQEGRPRALRPRRARAPTRGHGGPHHGQPELGRAAIHDPGTGPAPLPRRRRAPRGASEDLGAGPRFAAVRRGGTAGLSEGRFQGVSAALLLGGSSRRMGSDKSRLEIGGVPLATSLARGLSGLFEEVLLVGGDPPADAPGLRVSDPEGPRCALRGVVAALEAATRDKLLVVATDMPGLGAEVVLALLAWPEADAVVPRTAHGREPLCALYRRKPVAVHARRCLDEGRLALHEVLDGLQVEEIAGADLARVDPLGLGLANVNTPEELAAWQRAAAASPHPGPHW